MHVRKLLALIAIVTAVIAASVAADDDGDEQPKFIPGAIRCTHYDGVSDDLLTAGLGKTGLQSATSPVIADALNPTAAELRRLAIYINYRALADMTTNGGYGVLYGPERRSQRRGHARRRQGRRQGVPGLCR